MIGCRHRTAEDSSAVRFFVKYQTNILSGIDKLHLKCYTVLYKFCNNAFGSGF